MRLSEDWFELDLADENVNLDKWKYDISPQECKITCIPRIGHVVGDNGIVIHFKLEDCRIVNKATGETIAQLNEIESDGQIYARV